MGTSMERLMWCRLRKERHLTVLAGSTFRQSVFPRKQEDHRMVSVCNVAEYHAS